MTIESQLTELIKASTEQVKESQYLTNGFKDEIKQITDNIKVIEERAKSNHEGITQWKTQPGKVTLQDNAGRSYQVDTFPSLVAKTQEVNPNPFVMSKVQFEALRESRKRHYAGSGFFEWGQHWASAGVDRTINEGMWEQSTGHLYLGINKSSTGTGASESAHAKVVIDGVEHTLKYVASGTDWCDIRLPPAPDGTTTYDADIGRKQQYSTASEAFSGLVKDGDFFSSEDFWATRGNVKIEKSGRSLKITRLAVRGGYAAQALHGWTAKRNYVVQGVVKNQHLLDETDRIITLRYLGSQADGTKVDGADFVMHSELSASGAFKKVVTIPEGTTSLEIRLESISDHEGAFIEFSEIAFRPQSEHVLLSRKDLVALETWHEKITDKDRVYPLGNVQFGWNRYQDIELSTGDVAQSYSALDKWDTETVGHSAQWSKLSEAQKATFVSRPENNIYYDAQEKAYIQVRYRLRVVEGYSNDFEGVYPSVHGRTTEWGTTKGFRTAYVQGTSETISSKLFLMKGHSQTVLTKGDDGVAEGEGTSKGELSFGDTKPLIIPIALVQRLNQGAYHPSYNPSGCCNFTRVDGNGIAKWNDPKFNLTEPHSTRDCFTLDFANPNHSAGAPNKPYDQWKKYGSLADRIEGHSGRRDSFKFYDAIYASQVEDLRLNANKQQPQQILEKVMSAGISGKLRGKGSTPFTYIVDITIADTKKTYGRIPLSDADYDKIKNTLPMSDYPYNSGVGVVAYNPRTQKLAVINTISKFYSGMYVTYKEGVEVGSSEDTFIVDLNDVDDVQRNIESQMKGFALLKTPGNHSFVNTDAFGEAGDKIYVILSKYLPETFDSVPHVDVIGDPERIAATFPDGFVGQWIPAIPDGTQKAWPFNYKVDKPGNWHLTLDDGKSWQTGSISHDKDPNSYGSEAKNARVQLMYYSRDAAFTKYESNFPVHGAIGNVHVTQAADKIYGNRLQASLTGRVGKRSGGTKLVEEVAVNKLSKYAVNGQLSWTNGVGDEPTHQEISLDAPDHHSPAVKVLPSIIEHDGLYYLQCHGSELTWQSSTPVDITTTNKATKFTQGTIYRIANTVGGILAGRNVLCTASGEHAFDDAGWVKTKRGFVYNDSNDFVHFIELSRLDSGSWGDDQSIPILSQEKFKFDLNGNAVKTFCHHSLFPIGIAHKE